LPAEGCEQAHALQRKLFREGANRTLADVLVTITEYDGFVPAKTEAVRVEGRGCAFGSRVIAMTYGQRLDVYNLDERAYMPRLVGAPTQVLRVAMPGGPPVPLFAPKPGQYGLTDQTREFIFADVFVLRYPTFDVTGLGGHFKIEGVPVGKVTVSAFSPAMGKVVHQSVQVTADKEQRLSFELTFSESEHNGPTASGSQIAPQPWASRSAAVSRARVAGC
jgi:hypothetical protein